MAYNWVDKYINEKTVNPTGTPVVQQPQPQAQTQPVQQTTPLPSPRATKPTPSNPHGKIFSGGLVSKAIDVLRLPEYGIASFNKGVQNEQIRQKGKTYDFGKRVVSGVKNIFPGIQNRTQFGREEGDFNALAPFENKVAQNPKVQTALNFSSSLGAPSLPVAKLSGIGTRIAAKVPGSSKVAQTASNISSKVAEVAKNTPSIYNTLEKVPGLEYIRNKEVGKIIEGAKNTAEGRISGLYNTINDAAKGLSKKEREAIGLIIEGKLENAPLKLVQRANYVREISDKIGKEVVESGLMSPESFAKFQGKYLSHIADVVKKDVLDKSSKVKGMLSFTSDSLKQRKDKLGSEGYPDYIKEFQFPAFKSLAGEIQNVESVKAVKDIAGKFGKKVEDIDSLTKNFQGPRTTKEGLSYLEDVLPDKIAKQFTGLAVPQEVAEYINRKYSKNASNLLEKVSDKALNAWKIGKTIYSGPGYHVRNLMSNQILSDFATGAGLPATILGYTKAVKAYLGKGDAKTMQYLQELKDNGVIGRVSIGEGVESLKPEVFGQGESMLKKIVSSPKKFQNASEETAKLNVYSYFRNKGMDIKEAAAKAEEAIFSPYKINATERGLVKGAVPFYSFTRQAAPFVAKTAVKRGNTLTKYEKTKTAVEGLSPEGAGQTQPGGKGQIRLPIKDKNGNYIYADPSYVYPHGNFDQEGKGTLPFGLGLNPLISESMSQLYNKDLYFDQPIAKSNIPERAQTQRVQHAFQTFAPNIMPTDFVGGIPSGEPGIKYKTRGGSKLYDAFTNAPDYAGRTRSRVQAILDTFGLKSASVNPDQPKFDAINRSRARKALQDERRNLLKDKRFQQLSSEDKQKVLQQFNDAIRTF